MPEPNVKRTECRTIVEGIKTHIDHNCSEITKRLEAVETAVKVRNQKDAVNEGIVIGRKEVLEEIESRKENVRKGYIFWLSLVGGILFILQVLGISFTYVKARTSEDNNYKLEKVLNKLRETVEQGNIDVTP